MASSDSEDLVAILEEEIVGIKSEISEVENNIIDANQELAALKLKLKNKEKMIEVFNNQNSKIKKFEQKVSKAKSDLTDVSILFVVIAFKLI